MGIRVYTNGGDSGQGPVTIPLNTGTVVAGVWAYGIDAGVINCATWYNTGAAQNDEINYKVYLAAGTYKIYSVYTTSTNGGILNYLIDSVSVHTIDTYSNPNVKNVMDASATITISSAGLKTLTLKSTTKNAGSGAYYMLMASVSLVRQS